MQIRMTGSNADTRNVKRNIALFIAGFMLFAAVVSLQANAAGVMRADGVLTAIEEDGHVIIDEKGYSVSPSLTVQNSEGMSISLRDIKLPQYVHFEYVYTHEGFSIISIKENAV